MNTKDIKATETETLSKERLVQAVVDWQKINKIRDSSLLSIVLREIERCDRVSKANKD